MSTANANTKIIGRLPRASEHLRISENVWAALEASAPLTVIRAARGFGKTSVLAHWLRQYTGSIQTVYLTLDSDCNEEHVFWTRVGQAIKLAGVEVTSDDRSDVVNALSAHPRPLRLVLDNFHEAGFANGADQIDDDLVELVRGNEQFYLVASMRWAKALESVGTLAVDANVIEADDLRFTAQDVQHLASIQGVDLPLEQAEVINSDFGGWPAAIRAGLRSITSEGEVDENFVDGYVGAVLREPGIGEASDVVLGTAIPEAFDAELLRALAASAQVASAQGDGHARRFGAGILSGIRGTGLVVERRVGTDLLYSYPHAIRASLLRVMREVSPELESQVHRLLMSAPEMGQHPGGRLTHAIQAEEWPTALSLLERNWERLLIGDPDSLITAIRRIPAEQAMADPRIRVAQEHLPELIRRLRPGVPWEVRDGLLTTSDLVSEATRAQEPVEQESIVLLQWGLAALLTGNYDAAIYAFSHARDEGLRHRSAAAPLGTALLALSHALVGEPDLARTWLDDYALTEYQELGRLADPSDVTAVTVRIARALVAVDAGDADAVERLEDLTDPRHRADLWVLAEFVRAHYAAFAEDPEEVFRQANRMRAALRHVAKNTLSEAILKCTLVELLLVTHMIGVAGEIAAEVPEESNAWAARAKVFLARHEFDAAIEMARKVIDQPSGCRRSQMEATVVMASALHAMDRADEALPAFQGAVQIARATGQRRPFLLMQRYVFDRLAEQTPHASDLWPQPSGEAQEPTAARGGAELPTLTMREAQILRALERYSGPVGIGRALNLSSNTVKTHLRSIYRKLGVASRSEALEITTRGRIGADPDAHE